MALGRLQPSEDQSCKLTEQKRISRVSASHKLSEHRKKGTGEMCLRGVATLQLLAEGMHVHK